MAGELVVREARADDARAIAEVSVAPRRWSYRDLLAEADLDALSVEETAADFAEGLAELPPGAAVFVAELTGQIVGYAYVLPSADVDVPAETSELGSIYVTEEVAGTGLARALMDAAIEQAHALGQGVLTLWVRRENSRARRFCEKQGMRPDGAERSRRHDVLPTEMHTRFVTACRSTAHAQARGLDGPLQPVKLASTPCLDREGLFPGGDVASSRNDILAPVRHPRCW